MKRAALLVIYCLAASQALAADEDLIDFYANKPLRLTVGSSAGGGTDIVARLLARR